MITKVKVWKSPDNEYRVYVETDERQDGGHKSSRTYPVEGCYYLTGNRWHAAKSWDGNLTDEHKAEARRLSIKDGKWTTYYAPSAPAKPVEKQPDAKELARQAEADAEQAFIDAHGGVVANTQGTRYQRGELVIITGPDRSERVLVCSGSFYLKADWEMNEDGGWYARFCEPTAEEKQTAEYQQLQARIEADARHEAHVTEQARLAATEDGWDDVDWDMSLACNAGHHDNCSGKNCTCECHKPTKPEPTTFIPSVGPSDADFTRQFEHDTGIKTLRDDGGRDLGFYDFNDLKIAAGETHISGACGEHQHGQPCYDNRCQCPCHQSVPAGADFYSQRLREYQQMRSQTSGSALVAPAPEVHLETVPTPAISRKRFVTPLPDGYHVEQAPSGRWFVCLPDGSFLAQKRTGYARSYAHKSSATRAARREAARHA